MWSGTGRRALTAPRRSGSLLLFLDPPEPCTSAALQFDRVRVQDLILGTNRDGGISQVHRNGHEHLQRILEAMDFACLHGVLDATRRGASSPARSRKGKGDWGLTRSGGGIDEKG